MRRRLSLMLAGGLLLAGLPGTAAAAAGDIDTYVILASNIYGSAMDSSGNLYVANLPGHAVHKVTPGGDVSVFAGNLTNGFSGDGGQASLAMLSAPIDVDVDTANNLLFIADRGNNRIRMVDLDTGVISTVAGTTTAGYSGDGGAATSAELDAPEGVAVDGSGTVYVADTGNSAVRVFTVGGNIDTLGDPIDVGAVDVTFGGTVYAADIGGDIVHKIEPNGTTTPFAGDGTTGWDGDGGAATSASVEDPRAVAVDDATGFVYIAMTSWDVVRKVDGSGVITTYAGNGSSGNGGDGGPATSANLNGPIGLSTDGVGNLYISDYYNGRIRIVEAGDEDGDGFPDSIDLFPTIYSECDGVQATIMGTNAGEVIEGTSGDDVIMGRGGADTINGMGGNDTICAGNGDDEVYGGDGNDRIFGDAGTDSLYGEDGIDYLRGGNGDDHLYGGTGRDRLRGDAQNDVLVGDPADDRLFGGSGDDDLDGGGGEDRLRGGGGTDTLDGGPPTHGDDCIGETETNCEI